MSNHERLHKQTVLRLLGEVMHAASPTALAQLCAADYQPHVPQLAGVPALAAGLEALSARVRQRGALRNRVHRLIADGDLVFAQVHYADRPAVAGADIFRFDADHRIAEHWNLRQRIQDELDAGYDRYAGGGNAEAPASAVERALRRQRATDLYLKLWSKADASLVEHYYAEDYLQHNPHIPSGSVRIRQIIETSIAAFIAREQRDYPIAIHRLGCEGDLVFAHCSIYMAGLTRNEGDRSETVDIFRFGADGRLAEHWDVLQMECETADGDPTCY